MNTFVPKVLLTTQYYQELTLDITYSQPIISDAGQCTPPLPTERLYNMIKHLVYT